MGWWAVILFGGGPTDFVLGRVGHHPRICLLACHMEVMLVVCGWLEQIVEPTDQLCLVG